MTPHKIPHRLSVRANAFNWMLRLTAKPAIYFFDDHPVALKAFDTIYSQACTLLQLNHTPKAIRTYTEKLTHCEGEWVMAKGVSADKVIYYLHGGAYFLSSPKLHRSITWRLSSFNRRCVFALDYRVAPEHDITHCLEDAIDGYQHLLNSGFKPENIIIAGDSAGGHLSLLTLQYLRDHGLPLPAAAVLISPWTDLACESDSLHHNNLRDPYFWGKAIRKMGGFFADAGETENPLLSPVKASFVGLPPMMIMVGSIEVLRDDARRAARKALAEGVSVCYEEWQDMPHIFPFFSAYIPEARRAFKHMSSFISAVDANQVAWYVREHQQLHDDHPSYQGVAIPT